MISLLYILIHSFIGISFTISIYPELKNFHFWTDSEKTRWARMCLAIPIIHILWLPFCACFVAYYIPIGVIKGIKIIITTFKDAFPSNPKVNIKQDAEKKNKPLQICDICRENKINQGAYR